VRAQPLPIASVGDLVVGELFALRRHLEIRVGVANGFDEETFSASPATMAGPVSPPFNKPSSESK
jgi:hypothetical protein